MPSVEETLRERVVSEKQDPVYPVLPNDAYSWTQKEAQIVDGLDPQKHLSVVLVRNVIVHVALCTSSSFHGLAAKEGDRGVGC